MFSFIKKRLLEWKHARKAASSVSPFRPTSRKVNVAGGTFKMQTNHFSKEGTKGWIYCMSYVYYVCNKAPYHPEVVSRLSRFYHLAILPSSQVPWTSSTCSRPGAFLHKSPDIRVGSQDQLAFKKQVSKQFSSQPIVPKTHNIRWPSLVACGCHIQQYDHPKK